MPVIPILLSGGSGRRLWPLSRHSRPKQFLAFDAKGTLFRQAVERCRHPIFDSRPIVVAVQDHRFLVAEELRMLGADADVLLEPQAQNTCAAIAAGSLQALRRSADAMVLAAVVDHDIDDAAAFAATIARGVPVAAEGRLVAFAARDGRPDAELGYLRLGEENGEVFEIAEFVEKPDKDRASKLLAGGYLKNSGYYLFRASALLDELQRRQPKLYQAVSAAVADAARDLDFLRLALQQYSEAPAISFDRAIMEGTRVGAAVVADFAWTDVNDWDAVHHGQAQDAAGNMAVGDVLLRECRNNLVHSADRLTAMIGVEGMVVASTRDCLLVAPLDRASEVGDLVAGLEAAGRSEVNEALQIFRPWGNYERLDIEAGYQVKRIVVKPGGVLSLQRHRRRAEHWIVVRGRPEVTIGDSVATLEPNQSAYVPLGAVHRLANRGTEPVVLIEVQTGDYLGEDDIERIEDNYNRAGVS